LSVKQADLVVTNYPACQFRINGGDIKWFAEQIRFFVFRFHFPPMYADEGFGDQLQGPESRSSSQKAGKNEKSLTDSKGHCLNLNFLYDFCVLRINLLNHSSVVLAATGSH
jgi:hypothetical protein